MRSEVSHARLIQDGEAHAPLRRSFQLGRSVDALFEACAANNVVAVPVAGVGPRGAMLVPERGNVIVELTQLGGEDDVVSGGQTMQEIGTLLAGALDLVPDVTDGSHTYKNGEPAPLIPRDF
jgi:hypothetical protein